MIQKLIGIGQASGMQSATFVFVLMPEFSHSRANISCSCGFSEQLYGYFIFLHKKTVQWNIDSVEKAD